MRGRFAVAAAALGLVGSIGLLVLLAGCRSIPETRYYLLEAPPARAATQATAGGGIVLGVGPIRIDAPYDQQALVYRLGDGPQVGFYSYHRWAAPLDRLLPPAIAEALAGTPGLARAEPTAPGGRYDAYLTGRLVELLEIDLPADAEAGDGGSQVGKIELEIEVVTPDGTVRCRFPVTGEAIGTAEDVPAMIGLLEEAFAAAMERARAGVGDCVEGGLGG